MDNNSYHLRYQQCYTLSNEFTNDELSYIREGIDVWNYKSSSPRLIERGDLNCVFIGPPSNNETQDVKDFIRDPFTVGVSVYPQNKILILTERVKEKQDDLYLIRIRCIAGHEMGHWLGLSHSTEDDPSIMKDSLQRWVIVYYGLYPDDVGQLCKFWKCD